MHLEMVSLVLNYTVQERCGHTGVSPVQQHKDDLWNGLFDIWEAAQPGKGEAYRNLTNIRNIWWGLGGSKDGRVRLFSVVPSGGTGGNGNQLKYRKFHLNIREEKSSETGNAGTDFLGRLWCLHPWIHSDHDWRGPWATCPGWTCSEQRGWAEGGVEFPSNLSYSVVVNSVMTGSSLSCWAF